VKVCTLSGSLARSRCPVTQEVSGEKADRAKKKGPCDLHAKVCPVDGKPQSFTDPNTKEERLFCPEHGSKLVPVDD
jgi:hypothetical protein